MSSHSVGICRLHSHFKLDDGERVVTRPKDRGFLASVETEESYHPWQWRYITNKWVPVEFYQGPAPNQAIQEELLSFQSVMQTYFEESPSDAILVGVALNIDAVLGVTRSSKEVLHETTDESKREQMIEPVEGAPPGSIITRWFGPPGGREDACSHTSCSHTSCSGHK